jgi:hypothetical protein
MQADHKVTASAMLAGTVVTHKAMAFSLEVMRAGGLVWLLDRVL